MRIIADIHRLVQETPKAQIILRIGGEDVQKVDVHVHSLEVNRDCDYHPNRLSACTSTFVARGLILESHEVAVVPEITEGQRFKNWFKEMVDN